MGFSSMITTVPLAGRALAGYQGGSGARHQEQVELSKSGLQVVTVVQRVALGEIGVAGPLRLEHRDGQGLGEGHQCVESLSALS